MSIERETGYDRISFARGTEREIRDNIDKMTVYEPAIATDVDKIIFKREDGSLREIGIGKDTEAELDKKTDKGTYQGAADTLLPKAGGTMTGPIRFDNYGSNFISSGNGDATAFDMNNLAIRSWNGIGFGPTVDGQYVTPDKYSHIFNTRTGDMGMEGLLLLKAGRGISMADSGRNILRDHGNGDVTLSANGRDLHLGYSDGTETNKTQSIHIYGPTVEYVDRITNDSGPHSYPVHKQQQTSNGSPIGEQRWLAANDLTDGNGLHPDGGSYFWKGLSDKTTKDYWLRVGELHRGDDGTNFYNRRIANTRDTKDLSIAGSIMNNHAGYISTIRNQATDNTFYNHFLMETLPGSGPNYNIKTGIGHLRSGSAGHEWLNTVMYSMVNNDPNTVRSVTFDHNSGNLSSTGQMIAAGHTVWTNATKQNMHVPVLWDGDWPMANNTAHSGNWNFDGYDFIIIEYVAHIGASSWVRSKIVSLHQLFSRGITDVFTGGDSNSSMTRQIALTRENPNHYTFHMRDVSINLYRIFGVKLA